MRASKILTGFTRLTDGDLAIQAQSIFLAMTGNANFPTPVPALADIATAISDYTIALSNAKKGGELETAIKAQKREELGNLLNELSLYVRRETGGNETLMLSSGFKISKQPAPFGPLPKPENFKVTSTGKGEIKLRIKAVNGARIYNWEYRQIAIPGNDWTIKTNTKSTVLLTGMESGKEYEFRVLPVGASDIREYSDVICSFVL